MQVEIRTEDLQTLAEIGKALWVDQEVSRRVAVETLSAASLLGLTPDRAIERASTAMLDRASKAGMAANARANLTHVNQPFFRLFPEERFILTALHRGRWSYARLGRILKVSVEEVEALAWSARLHLCSSSQAYPTGSPREGIHCPEYEPTRPWTQRFMDEEIQSGRDRLFLQNHVMACTSCRQALNGARDIYYAVEAVIMQAAQPALAASAAPASAAQVRELEQVLAQGRRLHAPPDRSWQELVGSLFMRKDVWFAVAMWLLAVVFLLRHRP